VEHEIGEPPVRVTSAPFRLAFARRPPRGSRRAELMCDVSRDTPALAFGVTVPFSRSHHSTPERRATEVAQPSRKRRADTHSCFHHSRWERGLQERSCQSDRKTFPGRTGDTTG
jgi:hypothetical protein